MIPEPLHPAVVHFPIVLSLLLPIAVLWAIVLIRTGERARRAWLPPLILALALAGSSWLAVETGEDDEEAVEELVVESAIHEHEDVAVLFLGLAVGTLLVVGLGFLKGRPGSAARALAAVAAVAMVGVGYQVGHTGGDLVYVHGAADAYATGSRVRSEADTDRDDHDQDDEPSEESARR